MRSTRIYEAFVFLNNLSLGFVMTLYVPFLLEDLGLSYAAVSGINLAFWVTIVLAELPTGMLADGRGRGWSIKMGALFGVFGGFLLLLATDIWMAIISEVMFGLCFAFFSGAVTSWIADAPDRDEPLERVYGRATMIGAIASLAGTLIGTQLAVPFGRRVGYLLLTFGFGALTFFVARYMQGREPEDRMTEFEALKHSLAHLRRSAPMRWITFVHFLIATVVVFNLYWTPLALTQLTQIQLGYAWVPMYLANAFAAWLVYRLSHRISGDVQSKPVGYLPIGCTLVTVFAPLVFVALGQPVWQMLLIFLVHEMGRGTYGPLKEAFLDTRLKPAYRATFKSLNSFIGSLGMILTLLIVTIASSGRKNDPAFIVDMWFTTACVIVACTVLAIVLRPRTET